MQKKSGALKSSSVGAKKTPKKTMIKKQTKTSTGTKTQTMAKKKTMTKKQSGK